MKLKYLILIAVITIGSQSFCATNISDSVPVHKNHLINLSELKKRLIDLMNCKCIDKAYEDFVKYFCDTSCELNGQLYLGELIYRGEFTNLDQNKIDSIGKMFDSLIISPAISESHNNSESDYGIGRQYVFSWCMYKARNFIEKYWSYFMRKHLIILNPQLLNIKKRIKRPCCPSLAIKNTRQTWNIPKFQTDPLPG